MKRGILGSFFLLLIHIYLPGQQQACIRYTMDDGLPSNTIYKILQLPTGELWLATDFGIAAWNGTDFRSYGIEDGLPDVEITGMISTNKSQLLLMGYNKKACLFEGNTFKSVSGTWNELSRGPDSQIWMVDYLTTERFNFTQNKSSKSANKNWKGNFGQSWYYDFLPRNKLGSDPQNGGFRYPVDSMPPVADAPYYAIWIKALAVFRIDKERVRLSWKKPPPQKVSVKGLVWAAPDKLILATNKGLCHLFLEGDTIIDWELRFQEYQFNTVYRDHENNIWAGSGNNGLFLFPISGLINYPSDTIPMFRLARSTSGQLWWGSDRGRIGVLDQHGLNLKLQRQIAGRGRAMDMKIAHNGQVMVGLDYQMLLENSIFLPNAYLLSALKCIMPGKSGIWYIGTRMGTFRVGPETLAFLKRQYALQKNGTPLPGPSHNKIPFLFNGRTISLWYQEEHDRLFIGANEGLFIYEGDSIRKPHGELLETRINHIVPGPDGAFLLATPGKGLLVYREDSIRQYTVRDGLPSNIILRISWDGAEKVWVATNKGAGCLEGNLWSGEVRTLIVGPASGLPVSIAHDVLTHGDSVWIATEKGISLLPAKATASSKPVPPILKLLRIEINGVEQKPVGEMTLSQQSSLTVSYYGVAFRKGKELSFRYRVKGLHTDWTYTDERQFSIPSLPSGAYQLEVQAVVPDEPPSESLMLDLYVTTPLLQRPWFFGFVVLLSLGFSGGIFALVLRSLRRNNRREHHLRELKQKVLTSQMNPHFVFNAMNSIHAFIARQDSDKAHVYLGKFARLTRNILDNAQEQAITLEKELDNLRLYLELEKMRFQDNVDYEIRVEEGLIPNAVKVPPMLIQPFVENAILHGLRHLTDRQGRLFIRLWEDHDRLKVEIRDNGVGREMTSKMRAKLQHNGKSYGSKITAERIALIPDATLDILDLKDKAGNATGTSVLIALPTNFG